MKTPSALLLLALAAALWAAPAAAEKADRDKPMNVEADALRYDDLRQTSIFTGRVVATKGTIVIRGARIEVKQDADGYQLATITAEPGQRAFYRQKRDGVDEFMEGEGEVIEYDGRADRVKLMRRAELRRFQGTAVQDEISGTLVTYDNTTDQFTVDGGAPGTATAGAGGGRVRATLGPRTDTRAQGAAARPAAPPAQLRPSTTLGGGERR